jgi:hypothetical protein
MDLTRPGTDVTRGFGQAAQARIQGVAIWPIDGARGVPLALGNESPNPVPSQNVLTLGSPMSIAVGELKTISVNAFTLTDMSKGGLVPVQIMTSQNDPNLSVPASFVAIVPLNLLSSSTTYRAVFSGTAVDRLSGSFETIDRSWSFTTATQ